MDRPHRIIIPAILCLWLSHAGLPNSVYCAEPQFDNAPATALARFQAADILRKEVLVGPHYEIDDAVELNGRHYTFLMHTDWGDLEVTGVNLLTVRIREMHAIRKARELSGDPQIVQGLVETLHRTPEGARLLITDPAGSLLRVPIGIGKLITGQIDPADRRAGSETRRRIAVNVGCDPETTNPILKPLLDQLALRKGLGQLAGKVGLSVALPGLGLVPATVDLKETVVAKQPHEINTSIDLELADYNVGPEVRSRFLRNDAYTSLRKLQIVRELRELSGIENLPTLVEGAAAAKSEVEGLDRIRAMQLLAEQHRQHPLERIVATNPITATDREKSKTMIWVSDLVQFDPAVQQVVSLCQADSTATSQKLLVSGDVTRQASQAFQDAGVTVEMVP